MVEREDLQSEGQVEQSVQILPASWRDLNGLRHLEKACFPQDAWPLWDLVAVLTLPEVVRLKAEVNGRLVGFIAADIRPREKVALIATIGVLPEYRRRGVGRALLEQCETCIDLPTIRLNVRKSNNGAIRLYRSMGYEEAGVWAEYYSDGEDALVMEKSPSL